MRISAIYFLCFAVFVVSMMYLASQPILTSEMALCKNQHTKATYQQCRENVAKNFIKLEYPEVKDLSKMFFTLVSAVFVATITFWDKFLRTSKAHGLGQISLVAAWVSFLISIIACGIGLVFSAMAFEIAVKNPLIIFDTFAASSLLWLVLSGGLFVWGLILFTISGIWSLYHAEKNEPGDQVKE